MKCISTSVSAQTTPFNCEICTCNPTECPVVVDQNNKNVSTLSELNIEDTSLDVTTNSLNSTDFEFVSDDDNLDSRGLDFD